MLSGPQGQRKIITRQKTGKVTGHFEQEDNRGLLLHTARVHHARTCSVMPRFVIWSSPCCCFSNYVCQSPYPYEFITGREKTIATGKERERERKKQPGYPVLTLLLLIKPVEQLMTQTDFHCG